MFNQEAVVKLQKKAEKGNERAFHYDLNGYSAKKNTRKIRKQLTKTAHYNYLLQYLGYATSVEQFCEIAGEQIQKAKEYNGKNREVAELRLIAEHRKTWNTAEYLYERGSKILCQMMITVMDYILQERTGSSVLYQDAERSSYFDILDEITGLNEGYVSCYSYLCAYDFCTGKIAEFMEIEEYGLLIKEHERIVENGLPAKVTMAIDNLVSVGKEKEAHYEDLYKAFVPNPMYSVDQMESIYQRMIAEKYMGNEVLAMLSYSVIVSVMADDYEEYLME